MAEKVDEIAALLERLKIENDLNSSEFNSILLDVKARMEALDNDSVEMTSVIGQLREVLGLKISDDEKKFAEVGDTLKQISGLLENTTSSSDYTNLYDEVQTLTANFREAVESIVNFANKDTESKNILFEKVSELEDAVKNNEIIDVLKQRSDEVIRSFENYTTDSNLRHGNIISAMADLRQVVGDYADKNKYLINTLENTISANTEKLTSLDSTVSAQLGTVNSKLFSLGDDIHKILDNGFEHLKYLSTTLSETMNGNAIDMKTSLECLRANLSDYSEQLKVQMDDFTGAFDQKFADGSNIQTKNTQIILEELGALNSKIEEKSKEYEDSITEKSLKICEFLAAYREAVSGLQDENKDFLSSKLSELEVSFNDICSEYKDMLASIGSKLEECSSQISETSDSAVLGVINNTNETIGNLKQDLISSAASNLDAILGKVDGTSKEISEFKEAVAENLSNYLTAIKDLFIDYSDKVDSSLRGDEIVDKLSEIETLLKDYEASKTDGFDALKADIAESKLVLDDLAETVKNQNFDLAGSLKELKALAADSSSREDMVSRLEMLINEKSLSKDEQLRAIKDLLDGYSVRFDDIVSRNEQCNSEFSAKIEELKSSVQKILNDNSGFKNIELLINEKSEEKNDKLDTLRSVLAEYRNSVEQLGSEMQIQNGNMLSEISEVKNYSAEYLPKLDSLKHLEDFVRSSSAGYKSLLKAEVSQVKEALEAVMESVKSLPVDTDHEIIGKLAHFEVQLGESAQAYDQGMESLRLGINEYVQNVENIQSQTNEKLNASIAEIEKIQGNFDALSAKMTTLVGDSGLIEILANIRQQFNPVLQALQDERASLETSVNDSITSVNSTLYLIGQNLEEVRLKQSENAEYLRGNFEEKMLGLQADIEHTISEIKEIIDLKSNGFIENFESLKSSVDGFLGFDFGGIVSEVKDQLEVSYVNLTKDFHDTIEGITSFDRVEETYREAVIKFKTLEETVKETADNNFDAINQALLNVSSMLQNNYTLSENLQNTIETELIRIGNDVQENRISIKSSLVDLLEDIKTFISDKRQSEMENFRSAVLPLLDNEELLGVIRSVSGNLADRLEEFRQDSTLAAQDLLDVINSVNNTVDYTLDVINEKFGEASEFRKNIDQKLDAVNSKLDILAMDDDSELLDSVSCIEDDVSEVREIAENVSNIVSEINNNTVETKSAISTVHDSVEGIKDLINKAKDEIKSGLVYENILDEISSKIDLLSSVANNEKVNSRLVIIKEILKALGDEVIKVSQFGELIKVIDSKLDVIAMNDGSDVFEELQDVKGGIESIKDRLVENQKIEDLVRILDNKLDEVLQKDDSEVIEGLQNVSGNIEFIKNTLAENQKIEDSIKILDNKLDEIAQKDDSEVIEGLQNVSGSVEFIKDTLAENQKNSLIENQKIEDSIRVIDGKLDEIAKKDNSDVIVEVQDVKDSLEFVKKSLIENQKVEELIKLVDGKLDILAMNDDSEVIDELQEIKGNVGIIRDSLADNQKLEELVKLIDSKLDVLVQEDNSELIADVKEIKEELLALSNTVKSSEVENLIRVIDNKLNVLADTDDSIITDALEEIQDDTSAIYTDTKVINEKLDTINSANTDSALKLEELMNTLHSKVDVLAMADDGDLQNEISEIRELVEKQIAIGKSNDVKASLQNLLDKISEIDLSKQASEIKESIISALVSVSNEITFVEETEEIKDFVNEKTNELHRTMMDVKRQLTTLTCSGDDMDFYSYTLQDVESDLAKLRLILKDMSGESSTNEICVISNNISRMSRTLEQLQDAFNRVEADRLNGNDVNEQILSISTRLNQLILNKKEVDNYLLGHMNYAKEKLDQIDNSAVMKSIEKVLISMDEKLSYSNNLNTILKNVMMYLGEWMDGTTETISSIYDKAAKINAVTDAVKELRRAVPDRAELIDFIEARFVEQESKIDRLERQLDRISNIILSKNESAALDKIDKMDEKLEKLSRNIEKLASYVE